MQQLLTDLEAGLKSVLRRLHSTHHTGGGLDSSRSFEGSVIDDGWVSGEVMQRPDHVTLACQGVQCQYIHVKVPVEVAVHHITMRPLFNFSSFFLPPTLPTHRSVECV